MKNQPPSFPVLVAFQECSNNKGRAYITEVKRFLKAKYGISSEEALLAFQRERDNYTFQEAVSNGIATGVMRLLPVVEDRGYTMRKEGWHDKQCKGMTRLGLRCSSLGVEKDGMCKQHSEVSSKEISIPKQLEPPEITTGDTMQWAHLTQREEITMMRLMEQMAVLMGETWQFLANMKEDE
jgi:hypothetical protein